MIDNIRNYIQKDKISTKHIDVIGGIRVLAIAVIAWFHIWQQSWLAPYITIGRVNIDLIAIPRTGYILVDMFIMLSAFQLFLPHAREMLTGERALGAKVFYKRRLRRILPAYLLSVVVCLYFAVFSNEYFSMGAMLKDLVTHLTFTHTFWHETYLWTKLNVVLWTVAILVHFYILFPLLAASFKKNPSLTFLIMCAAGIGFRVAFVNSADDPSIFVNQLPAFFDVLAIGMFGAYITVLLNLKTKYQKLSPLFTFLSVMSLIFIYFAMKDLADVTGHENLQRWQGINRTWLALVFLMFVISTTYSMKWYRYLYSNKLMVFLASISFNFYIWHQFIAVKLRQWNFPHSDFADPNMAGDIRWQWLYTIACFAIAIAFAWLVTWLYEGKLIKALLKEKPKSLPPQKHRPTYQRRR